MFSRSLYVDADGIRVTVATSDTLPPLPAAVEVAAYLIAREALTNVARHAHASTCVVTLEPDPGGLRIEVHGDGHGARHRRRPVLHAGTGGRTRRHTRHRGCDRRGTIVRAELPYQEDT